MNRLLRITFLFFLLSVSALAQSATWPQDSSDLAPDPQVTFGQLDNGVRWAFLPNTEPPGRLSLRMFVKAGSLMEREDQRGLAHFMEHLGFNGTEHYAPDHMVEYFQHLGMSFGGDTNAHTWWKETVYKLELPNTEENVLNDSFLLLRDYGVGMLIMDKEIDKERGVILSEKNSRDSADYRAYVDELNFLFPHSIIPTRITIGLENVIANAPKQVFDDFYSKWYTPDRFYVVGAGDLSVDDFKAYVEKYFADIPANENPLPDPDMGLLIPRGLEARVFIDPELSTTTVAIENIAPVAQQADTFEGRCQDLKQSLAQAIITRRLVKLSQEEGSPIIQAYVYGSDFLNFAHNAGIQLSCAPENWADGMTIIEKELRKALMYGFTDAEITEIKSNTLNAIQQAAKSASTRLSRDLSSQMVEAFSNNRVFTSPVQDLQTMAPVIESITNEDLVAALNAEWGNGDRLLFVSGNLPLEGVREAEVTQVFLKSMSEEVAPPAEIKVADWAYSDFGTPGAVASQSYVEDLDLHQYQLSNNVFLNVKKTDYVADQVLVDIRFGSGMLDSTPAQEGYSLILGSTFVEGGLQAHSWDEMKQILAGKTVEVNFSVQPDSFVLGGKTNSDNFALQMQLMAAYFTAPGFRPEAYRQLSKSLDPLYNQLEHDVIGAFQKNVFRFMGNGDYRLGYPERSVLDAIDADAANAWLVQALQNSRIEISVVGDIDPDTVLQAVESTFGALSERKTSEPEYVEQRRMGFPFGQAQDFLYASELPKAIAGLGFKTTDMIKDVKANRRIGVLASVVGDRMRIKIREEIGESYSPMAFNISSNVYTDYGCLYNLVICQPDQAKGINEVLRSIAQDVYTNGANEDEFTRALKPVLNSIAQQRRTNEYWLGSVLSGSQQMPWHLDWAREMEADYAAITLEEINEAAKKYLDVEQAAEFAVLPQSAQ
ncbi:MAG: insulinase family protein [Opitutales bacterium]|nr:insulinase family protein [Opitutales bacterium]